MTAKPASGQDLPRSDRVPVAKPANINMGVTHIFKTFNLKFTIQEGVTGPLRPPRFLPNFAALLHC